MVIREFLLFSVIYSLVQGGTVVQWVERWTCDRQVVSSNPTRAKDASWASCSHKCVSVTKQYNLVPAKGRWCSVAGTITAGLAESNGSLPPGGWRIYTPAGWLPIYRDQLRGPTLSNVYGKPLPLYSLVCKWDKSSRSGLELKDTLRTNIGGLGLEKAWPWPRRCCPQTLPLCTATLLCHNEN